MKKQSILIMDFGGQYSQLIARRVRECNVYCEIKSYKITADEVKKSGYVGIIFSGGPSNVSEKGAPKCDEGIFKLGIPILGICYGAQLIALQIGGEVNISLVREYGKTDIEYDNFSKIFNNINGKKVCFMSHTYNITKIPQNFSITASTQACPIAAFENEQDKLYAVQFHPEVEHTEYGIIIIKNFLYNICKCTGEWKTSNFVYESINELKNKIGNKKVVCALSGGVDSSVAAVMVHKAIGNNLICIFVDHGLLRKNEPEEVERIFRNQFDMNLITVDCRDRFLEKLKGVEDPEKKRKIIGEEFIRVFEEEAKKIGDINFLCQGTIYSDVVESGIGEAQTIKSHHNVGGLPENIGFTNLIEPLRLLFKDEVRKAGLELLIPENLIWRQPFPGPGLAIRIMGEITLEKINLLKEADAIFREEITKANLEKIANQYFAVLTNIKSVGVMGDERTYDYLVALRAVTTNDFMTATWTKIPYDVLEKVSSRIVSEVKNINRVVYDITSKPPATVEWE